MALTDKIEIPRRTMVLFFLIDASGSMSGAKIGAVDSAIEEVIPALKDVSDDNADAQIKIAVLEFSSGARWITASGPVEVDQFHWNKIDAAGVTDFGAACRELNEKLSTKAFMKEAAGSYAPAIFLLSDGDPTDDWQRYLEELKQNNWFKAAVKVAVAIGGDANKDVLKEFTGTMEAVLETNNAATLKKMIKFVSVRASQVASKSSNVSDAAQDAGDEQKQIEVNAGLQEFVEETAAAPDNDQADW
ncbi:tellurium resistance protein TerY [Spirochaetia bacterium]|nr:tellurium resistance protein TerY [Spirochaetia bacterium]